MTYLEWEEEGKALFGPNMRTWSFVCPVCKHVATVQDWLDAGAPNSTIAFSCVGRWIPGSRSAFNGSGPGPCSYAGGGLFPLNPVEVDGERYFEFAKK